MARKYKEIGEILRKKRLETGRDIAGLAKEIRISEKFLEAIEEGRFQEFASPVYYELFARSYARELGINAEELFREEAAPEEPPITAEPTAPKRKPLVDEIVTEPKKKRAGKPFVWLGIIIVLGIVVALIIIFWGETKRVSLKTEEPKSPPVVVNQPDSTRTSLDSSVSDSSLAATILDRNLRLYVGPGKDSCWFLIYNNHDTFVNGTVPPESSLSLESDTFYFKSGPLAGREMRLNDTLVRSLADPGQLVHTLTITKFNKQDFYDLRGDTLDVQH